MNTEAPRTIDAIYLRPTQNRQGGHEVMDLTSGRVITRPRVRVLPATDLVIKRVEHLARKDGIKTLKFADRNGQVIRTTDFLAGVGTQNGDDTDEDDDDSYDSEEDEDYSDEEEDDDDDDDDDDDNHDRISRSEIDELFADDRRNREYYRSQHDHDGHHQIDNEVERDEADTETAGVDNEAHDDEADTETLYEDPPELSKNQAD